MWSGRQICPPPPPVRHLTSRRTEPLTGPLTGPKAANIILCCRRWMREGDGRDQVTPSWSWMLFRDGRDVTSSAGRRNNVMVVLSSTQRAAAEQQLPCQRRDS